MSGDCLQRASRRTGVNLGGWARGESVGKGASGGTQGHVDGTPARSPRAEPMEHSRVLSFSNYMSTYYSLLIKRALPPAPAPSAGYQAQSLGWAGPLNGEKQGGVGWRWQVEAVIECPL